MDEFENERGVPKQRVVLPESGESRPSEILGSQFIPSMVKKDCSCQLVLGREEASNDRAFEKSKRTQVALLLLRLGRTLRRGDFLVLGGEHILKTNSSSNFISSSCSNY